MRRRSMPRFRGVRKRRCHGICGIPRSLATRRDGGLPLERKTLRRSLGSHDAATLVDGMCNSNGYRQETTRLHAVSCTSTGWSSLAHNRVLHRALAPSLRESGVQSVVEGTGLFRQIANEQQGRSNPLRMDLTTKVALFDNHSQRKKKGSCLTSISLTPLSGPI